MKHAIVTINESLPSLATILGQGKMRIPTGGKIRAGIKVLTKRAAEHPTAKDIYDRGVAGNQSFEEIERAICQAIPNLKTPLVPKNVAWFTVRPGDFPNPETASQILDAFGEDRGDGVKRLYRFPVIFPADTWHLVMPHELVAWGAHEKKFWSEYAPDGRVRYCKCYAPVAMGDGDKRAMRVFGGRKTMLRDENGGICNPDHCPEFQSRQCNLSGRFIFFIPGIRSINAFELHTSSFYAMRRAIEQFETLAFLRGGRISGFLDEQRTPFYLTKKLREMPHVDDNGRPVRSVHWIIELEAPIDIAALLHAHDDAPVRLNTNGNHPAGGLGAGDRESQRLEVSSDRAPENQAWGASERLADVASSGQHVVFESDSTPSAEQVIAAANAFGVDAARYAAYADGHWGPGWRRNANGRRRALDEIERYRNDPDTFVDKVDAALKAAHQRI